MEVESFLAGSLGREFDKLGSYNPLVLALLARYQKIPVSDNRLLAAGVSALYWQIEAEIIEHSRV